MIKYMIHACPQRFWYVEYYMLPALREQGIDMSKVYVWIDTEKWGNLRSFFHSMEYVRDNFDKDSSVWHLQDDVLIASDFRQRTDNFDEFGHGYCCYGFCNDFFNPITKDYVGFVPIEKAWSSFQCVRIPNLYAGEFLDWYQQNKSNMIVWGLAKKGECDDTLFNFFLQDWHREDPIINIAPNLVEHVDFLLGGSTLTTYNGMTLSYYWNEPYCVDRLAQRISDERINKYHEIHQRIRLSESECSLCQSCQEDC